MSDYKTAIKLSMGETVDRKDISHIPTVIVHLEAIDNNCTKALRQLSNALNQQNEIVKNYYLSIDGDLLRGQIITLTGMTRYKNTPEQGAIDGVINLMEKILDDMIDSGNLREVD